MRKTKYTQSGKISAVFIVVITVTITAFIAAMMYISSLQTPTEQHASQRAKEERLIIAEEAQRLGISVEENTKIRGKRKHDYKHIRKIESAINTKDDALLDSLFKEDPDFDFAKYKVGLFNSIAIQKNENAFRYFLKKGLACDYDSPLGQHAFRSLLQTPYVKYLNLLLEHGCKPGIENGDPLNILSVFAKSPNPERVLSYPLTDKNMQAYELAFIRSIQLKKTEAALDFIDRGINLNNYKKTNRGKYTPLSTSIRNNETKVALRLIEKGAELIENKKSVRQNYPLLMAINMKRVAVVKAILERDPNMISREKIADRYFTHSLSLYDADPEFDAINLGFKGDLSPSDFKADGVQLLLTSIRAGNATLVEKLASIGVAINTPYKMELPLKAAKLLKHQNAEKIIEVLEKQGATDDYLAIVRDKRNISDHLNCSVGEKIALNNVVEEINNLPISKRNKMQNRNHGACLIAVTFCANNGMGSDDCVKSLPVCEEQSGSQNTIQQADKVNVCCSTTFKQNYEEARCSGLNVTDTFEWIDSLDN